LTVTTQIEEWRAKVFIQLHRVTRVRAGGGEDLICEGRETRTFVRRDETGRLRSMPVPDDIRSMCE
jgi:4-hydroxybenzoyl-CoA thioesterase